MKGLIFVFFLFNVVFGQVSNTEVPDSEREETAAEGQESSTAPALDAELTEVTSDSSESPEASEAQAPTSESELTEAARTDTSEEEDPMVSRKNPRLFRIINDYELPADKALRTLVVIAADARLQGRVTGNVLVIGGDAQLSQEAQVDGTLHIIGGSVEGGTEKVEDLRIRNGWETVPAALHLVLHPHLFWGISKEANFRLTFIKFGVPLLMYLLIAGIFSRPVNEVRSLLASNPIGSILFSLLIFVTLPVVLALLTLSIIGVPFMLLFSALLLPLAIFGKTAIFLTFGSTLFSGRWRPLAVIFGYTLYFMAVSLPYIDWAAYLLVNTLAIGLCIMAAIRWIRGRPQRTNTTWAERM